MKKIKNIHVDVNPLGIGAGGLGGMDTRDSSNDSSVILALETGFSLGMNLIDTAEVYGGGHSEELVGVSIKNREVVVASKVSPENLGRERLIKSLDESLLRLGVEVIDLYQVHWPNPLIPLSETMGTLNELVSIGKIKAVGLCNFTLDQIKEASLYLAPNYLSTVQLEYNLFDRSCEEDILPFCAANNIKLLAYSPLDQGSICGRKNVKDKLQMFASKHECSVATLALAWLIRRDEVLVIPKSVSVKHVRENALATSISLSDADYSEIAALTVNTPELIDINDIEIVPGIGVGARKVYVTLDEALSNIYGFVPSPSELAEDMLQGKFLKPIRLMLRPTRGGSPRYELVEGRIRYWAWIIAFGINRPIPALVRDI